MPTIYVHKVDRGIKIGYTDNYEQRKRQYSSHGDTIIELGLYEILDKKQDDELKRILYKLGKNVKIPKQSTTEVYDLTEHEAKDICQYLETNKEISEEIVMSILNPAPKFTMTTKTMEEFKQKYGNTYVTYRHQRAPQEVQIGRLRSYIMSSYMKPTFYLTPIILAKNKYDQYDIIDGNHRSIAISRIPNGHPSLKQQIHLNIKETVTNNIEMTQIFRNINEALPMSKLYVADDFLSNTLEDTFKQINQVYARDSAKDCVKITMFQTYINKSTLREFITRENVIYLIHNDHIKGIQEKEIFFVIRDLNTVAYNAIIDVAGFDIFRSKFPKDYDERMQDLISYLRNFNKRVKDDNLDTLQKVIDDIRRSIVSESVIPRNSMKTKVEFKKETKEPFVLGLFKIDLLELFKMFVVS